MKLADPISVQNAKILSSFILLIPDAIMHDGSEAVANPVSY